MALESNSKSLFTQFPQEPVSNFFKITGTASGVRSGHVSGATVNSPAQTLRVPGGGMDTHSTPTLNTFPQTQQPRCRCSRSTRAWPAVDPLAGEAGPPAASRSPPLLPAPAPRRASGSALPKPPQPPQPPRALWPTASFHKSPGAQPAPAFHTGAAPPQLFRDARPVPCPHRSPARGVDITQRAGGGRQSPESRGRWLPCMLPSRQGASLLPRLLYLP